MMSPDVAQLIAAERIADRERLAAAAHLARIARGCRESAWSRSATSARAVTARLRGIVGHRHRVRLETAGRCTCA